MKNYITILILAALCTFSAKGDESAPISQIPASFLGSWAEKNEKSTGDIITIKQDQLTWTRTDKLNKGDYTIKVAAIQIFSSGALTFTVKNKQSATMEGLTDAVVESDMTVIAHSENGKLRLEKFIFVFSGNFGGAGMGGQRREDHCFEKQ